MKKVSKEFKIGLSFLIAIFVLYFGINFLKGFNIFKPSNSYVIVFDNVEGLTLSTPVTLNGFQVGTVSSISLSPQDRSKVIAGINMDKGMQIPKGSKMTLDVSVLGNATIGLELNPYTEEHLSAKDTIIGIRKKGFMDAAASALPQLEKIIPRIDSILAGIQLLVTNPALNQSLTNVSVITDDLSKTTKQLNAMAGSLNKDLPVITGSLKSMSSDLSSTTKKINQLDIAATYKSLDSTMKNFEELSTRINSKDNSLGLLLNDTQLHDSLTNVIGNTSSLLRDVQTNPKKYINIKVF